MAQLVYPIQSAFKRTTSELLMYESHAKVSPSQDKLLKVDNLLKFKILTYKLFGLDRDLALMSKALALFSIRFLCLATIALEARLLLRFWIIADLVLSACIIVLDRSTWISFFSFLSSIPTCCVRLKCIFLLY